MIFFNFLRLLRVHQWVKNVFVFVPLLFSLHLFDEDYLITTLFAFIVFLFICKNSYSTNGLFLLPLLVMIV